MNNIIQLAEYLKQNNHKLQIKQTMRGLEANLDHMRVVVNFTDSKNQKQIARQLAKRKAVSNE